MEAWMRSTPPAQRAGADHTLRGLRDLRWTGLACVDHAPGCAMLDVLRTCDPLRGNIAQRETFIAQLATLRQWLWLHAHAPSSPRDWPTTDRDLPCALAAPGSALRVEGGDLVLQPGQGRPAAWRLPQPRTQAGKVFAQPDR